MTNIGTNGEQQKFFLSCLEENSLAVVTNKCLL